MTMAWLSALRAPRRRLPHLHPAAWALIDPRQGPLPAPVRSLLFGVERFRQHGQSLARAQLIERRQRWRRRIRAPHFFPRIAANLRSLERARGYLETLDREGEALSPAAEWLLDNFHLIEAQVPEVHTGLPRSYYGALPKLRSAPLRGLPRVYGIAWAFVTHTDSSFDAKLLAHFLAAYQEVDLLTLGELWAIPSTLRIVLLENLARLAEAVAGRKAAREAADWCCDHEGEITPARLQALFERLQRRALHTSFLAQMAQRVRGHGPGESSRWADWLAQAAPDTDALLTATHEIQAADNVSVSNAVSALHAINHLQWNLLVDECSPVLQLLRQAPAFVADSPLTRDQCTHAVERLAHHLWRPELDVARAALALDAEAGAPTPGPAHWLIGPGQATLVAALGGKGRPLEPVGRRAVRRLRGPLYAGALLGGSLLVLDAALADGAFGRWQGLVVLPFAALAAFESVVAVLNRILAELVPVDRLPRLALDAGVQPEQRTLVVIPCLLSSAAGAAALVRRMERHHLANPEACTRFALLSDWADADTEHQPEDGLLLDAARRAIEALNQRHPAPAGDLPRFALLHRPRQWSAGENVWMGWERKRGKLDQLLTALDAGPQHAAPAFVNLGPLSALDEGVRFVVTLDADTDLPPGALRDLVAIAAHPLNQPRLDPHTRRVISGYGILQPRIDAPLPARETVTRFGWMFSGPWGFDFYNAGSSEIYQDVFGQGSFNGKGLLHVGVMAQALRGRVPENRLLSHDLYEGVWARSAHLSDVSLVETAPQHPDVAASQVHRWTRGDWQLAPLLRTALRGRVGALNLWKMLDNLRRSLVVPASLVLLWLSFAAGALAPAIALALVAAALGLGPVLGALAGLLPPRLDLAMPHFLREGRTDVLRALLGTLWQIATLPHAAAVRTDAIVRALWRMAVSHRRLLQWTTAAQAQAQVHVDAGWFWRRHFRVCLLAVVWTASGAWMPAAHLPWLLGIGALWTLAPLWLWWVAQPIATQRPADALDDDARAYLRELARDTWSLFETIVTPADHDLPPDNLQIDPEPMIAHRTSPTNIGLYLSSTAVAQRMGFIDRAELVRRLQAALASLDRLPRWNGHFYNWIDTATLQALTPRYVSTVDSGNLAACLWAVAQCCRELAARPAEAGPPTNASELQALALRLDGLAAAMDFAGLYDPRRRLFHIGYRLDDASLDPAYYDLLASESRLTSFVAIAKGDVPLKHWQALGRPFLAVEGQPVLRSWSGSMFEYLMAPLLMHEPKGSLLHGVAVSALQAQRRFGEQHGTPWGVSECAYFEQDHSLAFQYGPFGVPQLALRRTPVVDHVIAPYASALALQFDPVAALANLKRLEALGARRRHGFIEALDFSRPRRGESGSAQSVATFMAHHQGMTLLSLCNLLCDGAPRGWFERAPPTLAYATLLHERMPRAIVLQSRAIPRPPHEAEDSPAAGVARVIDPALTERATLPSLLIGNGAYSLCLRPDGGGQSRWRANAISRARDDLLRDAHGQWLLLRRADAAARFSVTQAPCPAPGTRYQTRFYADHAEYDADHPDWTSRLDVWVSPDDDVELRRLLLHNLADQAVEFELTSYFEAVLAPQRADESHPAFSNLFIQAHVVDPGCLLLERRPRRDGERGLWLAHFLATCDGDGDGDEDDPPQAQVACDRAAMLPRGGGMAQLRVPPPAGVDTGLDPVASVSVRLRIAAHARRCVTLATAAADNAETLMAIVDEYRQEVHLARSQRMSATLARIRQRELRLGAADLRTLQDLATPMTSSRSARRDPPAAVLDRRALWRFGISGDRPLAVLSVSTVAGMRVVRSLLTAHRLWDLVGLNCDLVIVNGEPPSYLMPLQQHITEARASVGTDPHLQPERGAVHVLKLAELAPHELATLRAHARIDLVADGRPLNRLLDAAAAALPTPHASPAMAVEAAGPAAWPAPTAPGEFADQGRAFHITIDGGRVTPRPWANVLANPQFGCIVTESGGGYTWAINSALNQLTPWSNDPLVDPAGEHFWVHDRNTGQTFGLLPSLDRNASAGVQVSHRAGLSAFTQERPGLAVQVDVMVHPHEAVKCLHVRLHSRSAGARRLRLLGMVEWVLGAHRRDRMTLQTEYVGDLQALLARQLEHSAGFGEGCAFLMLAGLPVARWTGARAEFFNRAGRLQWPDRLAGTQGFGLDPCAGLEASVVLEPGQSVEFHWLIGYAPGRAAALALARRMAVPGALAALAQQVGGHWDEMLSATQVHTPDPLFDALVNRWLLYQTIVCRLWARAGFYQAGGATGFRDQLQDALALLHVRPQQVRSQLLLHASRQFAEGDVQHWWHQPGGAGVRTRFSDDLLWLPYALAQYLDATGDAAVLDESVPFLEGGAVPAGAEDLYETPTESGTGATLFEHAARAIDKSLAVGVHGLPLMGGGDWNDGMNRVGHEGRGESVWLAWFLIAILRDCAPLARQRGEAERAARWDAAGAALRAAVEAQAWDGAWYRRAYFDNGHALGAATNDECRIDLIAQAWSVLAADPGAPPPARAVQAMDSADLMLVDRRSRLIRLLDPPLQDAADRAGYIQSYPAGVRENGGQYTHAAVWALMAQARLGHAAKAWEYFVMISPAHRARSTDERRRYGIEPYVLPGDTYSAEPHCGRGGWSWYTGSAAWLYRAAIESLLGLTLRGDRFCLRPCLPPHWPDARLTLRLRRGKRLTVLLQPADAPADPRDTGARQIAVGEWLVIDELPACSQLVLTLPPLDGAGSGHPASMAGQRAPQP